MKRRCRFGSRSINFSVALLLVILAHAALLLAWPADTPPIRVVDRQAPTGLVADVAIVEASTTTTAPSSPAATPILAAIAAPIVIPAQAEIHGRAPEPLDQTSLDSRLRGNDGVVHGKDAPPLQIPAATRLAYSLVKGSSSANVVLNWQTKLDAARQITIYELSLEAESGFFTILKQTSTGAITPRGLAPIRYSDKRVAKSEQATHFDAANGTVTFSNNRSQAAWVVGSQDRVSVLVQLAALAQGKAATSNAAQGAASKFWQVGEIIQLPVASTDELELWQWEVQPQAEGDASDSIRLMRRPRRAFDATIEVWLSAAIGYLPSRIRQTDSSGVTDQVLTRTERP